jgi:SAM-dependent methyltransferase
MKTDAGAQSSDISLALESLYAGESGRDLVDTFRARLQPILDVAFGYHILQLGPLAAQNLIADSPINHRFVACDNSVGSPALICHGDELPIESESVDMIVALHALDFSPHPHGCLREMQRVLRSRGHLVIIGFNPRSIPGALRALRGLRRDSLWSQHHPVSLHRLTDWLHLVDCELEEAQHLHAIARTGQNAFRRASTALDGWAIRHGLPGGSLYLAHAIKQRPGLRRPHRLVLAPRPRLSGLAVAGRPSPAPRHPGATSRDRAA